MTVAMPGERADEHAFLSSVEGEISFFRSIMRARPVGIHRYFHVLAIRNAILKETGRSVHVETIWEKLRECYDLDALDAIDIEAQGYLSGKSNSSPVSIRSPSPSENLAAHPFFREEFSLPYEEFEPIIAQRRLRSTASLPSTPATSPAPMSIPTAATAAPSPRASASTSGNKRGAGRKRGTKSARSKLNLAGLVGGDSDSSALTLESGDEGGAPETPRESVVTGTDAGTEYAEDEDTEMREPSPAAEASPKPTRGRPPKAGRRGRAGAPRGAPSTRGAKKRKR
ncbi:MRG/MORF4L-binding protein [Psilocybe cubensis]|uniref:MRG/MORF4L-binding protein n=2 Tax=Psilocybe cubensis TaxID=181762 RepID=A0ACB8GXY1_PSICU|nr:MRG/MORF4L-binding protein [Psilocybe cubensis]KAH9480421.1 MRG/MORF4L-binding protein [Psilocybe cubensis]